MNNYFCKLRHYFTSKRCTFIDLIGQFLLKMTSFDSFSTNHVHIFIKENDVIVK